MLKPTDRIVLSLELSVAEARALRDELYCAMSDLDAPDMADMVWSFELKAGVNEWLRAANKREYRKKVMPAIEKAYSALRVALGLKPDIPVLGGAYTTRNCLKVTEAHFKQFVKNAVNTFLTFYDVETFKDERRGEKMLKALSAALKLQVVLRATAKTDEAKLFVRFPANEPEPGDFEVSEAIIDRIAKRLKHEWDLYPMGSI